MSVNNQEVKLDKIKSKIATYTDFPKKGIIFFDIMPILSNPEVFQDTLDILSDKISSLGHIDVILALESRGFFFAPTLALKHKIPFLPIRKKGKLPGPTRSVSYSLEYGQDSIEIQDGQITNGSKVVIIDDLLATGGTLGAAVKLVNECGGQVSSCLVIIELKDLKGSTKVNSQIYSMFQL